MGWFAEIQIRRRMRAAAIKQATAAYERDVMFRALQGTDFNYAIMQDLMRGAGMVGKITVKLTGPSGDVRSEIVIEGKSDLTQLNELDRTMY